MHFLLGVSEMAVEEFSLDSVEGGRIRRKSKKEVLIAKDVDIEKVILSICLVALERSVHFTLLSSTWQRIELPPIPVFYDAYFKLPCYLHTHTHTHTHTLLSFLYTLSFSPPLFFLLPSLSFPIIHSSYLNIIFIHNIGHSR